MSEDAYKDFEQTNDLDNYIEYWHTHETGLSLQEFLGMTDCEFEAWGRCEHD